MANNLSLAIIICVNAKTIMYVTARTTNIVASLHNVKKAMLQCCYIPNLKLHEDKAV